MRYWLSTTVLAAALTGCASPPPKAPDAVHSDELVQARIDHAITTGTGIKTDKGDVVYCREESVTNTRLRNRKLCMTKAEWEQRAATAQDAYNENNRSAMPTAEGEPTRPGG